MNYYCPVCEHIEENWNKGERPECVRAPVTGKSFGIPKDKMQVYREKPASYVLHGEMIEVSRGN